MANNDYYQVLGVSKDASDNEIKHAYRMLSKKYHPDINKAPGAEAKFKEITEAYDVLSNKQKRSNYDQFGSESGPQGFGGFGNGNSSTSGGYGNFNGGAGQEFGGFEDIFNQFFGGGGGNFRRQNPNAPQRGKDLEHHMTLSFDDAAFGKKAKLRYNREAVCPTCNGTGAKPGTSVETCPECDGTGYVVRTVNTPLGQMQSRQVCPRCHGTGKIIKDKCPTCHGNGRVVQPHEVEVKVPAGIEDGQQLRLSGQGTAGKNGGPYGDLYISFKVLPSKTFKRKGADIFYEKPISFPDAVLGSEVDVKTLRGKAKLKIPAGTESGTTFRLKGQGVPKLNSFGKGDEKVKVKVDIPKNLNKDQKMALRAFAEASGDTTPKGNGPGFLEKLKDAFK